MRGIAPTVSIWTLKSEFLRYVGFRSVISFAGERRLYLLICNIIRALEDVFDHSYHCVPYCCYQYSYR
ncbi:MAG: hypothetical protein GPOALKHO_000076 [Sodalis sp.]|nr:MAG: hypothetical protein GPOALKHO_000076 [Sodalis sp.]